MQNAVPHCEIGTPKRAVCNQKSPTVEMLFLIDIRDYVYKVRKEERYSLENTDQSIT